MRNLIVVLWVAFLVAPAVSFAQQSIYRAADGRIYIQAKQELYLFIGASDSPTASKVLLDQVATPEYANPFFLDTEGVNYIRTKDAVNKETGEVAIGVETLWEIHRDGTPPAVSYQFENAPRFVRSGTVYYGAGLTGTLVTTDELSGVLRTQFVLNGGAERLYADPLSFSEGAQTISATATDNVGNTSEPASVSFVVDLSAPVVSDSLSGEHVASSRILSGNGRIHYRAEDDASGVFRMTYQVDDGGERTYTSPLRARDLGEGPHTITVSSVDHVGNTSAPKTDRVVVDLTPPDVAFAPSIEATLGGRRYVSGATTFTMTAEDAVAGVEQRSFRTNGDWDAYQQAVAIPEEANTFQVAFRATDRVQNTSSPVAGSYILDRTAPTTRLSKVGPQVTVYGLNFVTSATRFRLDATDVGSGVASTTYQDGAGARSTYDEPFSLERAGKHTLTYRSTDRVENVEQDRTYEVTVDNEPPQPAHRFSIASNGQRDVEGVSYEIYAQNTRIYLSAQDDLSGTNVIRYKLNEGSWQVFDDIITGIRLDTPVTMQYYAEDFLGNRSDPVEVRFILTP